MAREKIAGFPIERRLTIAQAVGVALALSALKPGKVEKQPKEPEKPKFRKVLRRTREASEGEIRELEQSSSFRNLCFRHNIPPTHRQASKFFHKRGRAWMAHLKEKES